MGRDLVTRAMAGDHGAFSELARASIGRLYAAARLILRDDQRAEDATQEALVAAWRDLSALRDPDRFDAFIQQGGLSAWDVAAAGLVAERGGATVTAMDGGPWFDLGHSPKSIGIVAAPPAHHRSLLELVR